MRNMVELVTTMSTISFTLDRPNGTMASRTLAMGMRGANIGELATDTICALMKGSRRSPFRYGGHR